MQTLESNCIPRGGYMAAKAKKGEYMTVWVGHCFQCQAILFNIGF